MVPLMKTISLTAALVMLCLTTVHGKEGKDEKELDYGDFTSSTLTTKAWKSLEEKKYDHTIKFAKKCIEMFEKDAVKMQSELKEPVSGDKETVASKWALNDVGTCYFIMGQAYEKMKNKKKALESYKLLAKKVSFAQCWDPNGWFWKPMDAGKKRIKQLEFELLEEEDSKK